MNLETDILWTHDATQVYTKIGAYTIWNLSISNPHASNPFVLYVTVNGKEVDIGAYATLTETLGALQRTGRMIPA